jgi:general secretion pathway protein H
VVVIAILAMAAVLVIPRLPSSDAAKLKNSARNLASGIRFLNDQAIITKGVYRLRLNVGENTTRIVKVSATGEEVAPDDTFMNRQLIADEIVIEDVIVPQLGTVTNEDVKLTFGPGGYSDCITIHLKGGDKHFTVIAYPSGGKVKVLEGYQDLEKETTS